MAIRIAMISAHASPLAMLGGVDASGQRRYVGQLARHLARLGFAVDVLTRRNGPRLPDEAGWGDDVRIVHIPADRRRLCSRGSCSPTWASSPSTRSPTCAARIASRVAAIVEDVVGSARTASTARSADRVRVDLGLDRAVEALEQARCPRRSVVEAAATLSRCFEDGGRAPTCGTGGSATPSRHLASELVGRFAETHGPAELALALTTHDSVLTGRSRDHGHGAVFARQVEANGRPGDVLEAFSTSGRSPAMVAALATARARGMRTLALLGGTGGPTAKLADVELRVPSHDPRHIQEVHKVLVHLLCEVIESQLVAGDDLDSAPMLSQLPPAELASDPAALA